MWQIILKFVFFLKKNKTRRQHDNDGTSCFKPQTNEKGMCNLEKTDKFKLNSFKYFLSCNGFLINLCFMILGCVTPNESIQDANTKVLFIERYLWSKLSYEHVFLRKKY